MLYHSGAATYIMPTSIHHIRRRATCIYCLYLFLGDALLNLQASPSRFMPEPFIGGFPIDGSYQGHDFGLSRLSHLRPK